MRTLKKADAECIRENLSYLSETIGPRLSGSEKAWEAIHWIEGKFKEASASVEVEEYPVNERAVRKEKLEVYVNGKWTSFPITLFGSAPGTKGKTLSGDIVLFTPEMDFARKSLAYLKDKAVLMWGSHIEKSEHYGRLMAAKPKFLMVADPRYPTRANISDGLFPACVQKYGAVPTVNVGFLDAWDWIAGKATKARLRIDGGLVAGKAGNVVCTLQGTDATAGTIYVGCHLDTQANCPGADDNGSGVVSLIELASILAPLKHKRTIKLIAFDSEEQLSVGSATYVRRHREEIERDGVFMFNIDTIGSIVGIENVIFQTDEAFRELFAKTAGKFDYIYKESQSITPYSDHFAFCAAGVPSMWVYRHNCDTGRFFHHQADDDMSRVDCEHIAQVVDVAASFIHKLSTASELPFSRKMPKTFVKETQHLWQTIYGGWAGLGPLPKGLLEEKK